MLPDVFDVQQNGQKWVPFLSVYIYTLLLARIVSSTAISGDFAKRFEKQLLFGCCVKILKRIGCRGLLILGGLDCCCGFRCTAVPIKLFLKPCDIYAVVVVQNVGIPFRDHRSLCKAGVTLNVASTELEFVGCAGMPGNVKDPILGRSLS